MTLLDVMTLAAAAGVLGLALIAFESWLLLVKIARSQKEREEDGRHDLR